MEPQGLGRVRRVLVAAGLFALVWGLWTAPPAQATVRCQIQDYRSCGRFICCLLTCIYCVDDVTGYTSDDCSEVVCWDKST